MNDYLEFAKDLAQRAGDVMLEHFQPGIEREIKSDATPVTIADTSINKMVIDAVEEKYPDHSVMGEEESSEVTTTEFLWVCDPIDGTIPYTLGIPTSLFSIALVHNGESIVGVLYDPYTKRMFTAVKGGGAQLNGESIRVNNEVAPMGYVTLPTMQYGITNTANLVADAMNMGIRSFSLCCITYEAMLVATGQITGSIFPGKTPWDIAAVKVVVEEAGGKVTDLYGNNQSYDRPIKGAIVSNGQMHDELVTLASKHIRPEE
jgi:fructose-1,6-bisphosphatase/inositol monophosphatase family enzyme